MKQLANLITIAAATGFSSVALAHGGHGATAPASIIHYLLEPMHLVPAAAAVAVAAIAIAALRRKSK